MKLVKKKDLKVGDLVCNEPIKSIEELKAAIRKYSKEDDGSYILFRIYLGVMETDPNRMITKDIYTGQGGY